MGWRPEKGWKTAKPVMYPLHCLAADQCVAGFYEAGADAMYQPAYDKGKAEGKAELLEALKKTGCRMTRHEDGSITGMIPTSMTEDGWLVFIPEDKK